MLIININAFDRTVDAFDRTVQRVHARVLISIGTPKELNYKNPNL